MRRQQGVATQPVPKLLILAILLMGKLQLLKKSLGQQATVVQRFDASVNVETALVIRR